MKELITASSHANYSKQKEISRKSAEVIVPIVIDIIKPKSVADVGCGIGAWLSVFLEKGITDIIGIDGNWVPREHLIFPEEFFVAKDLRNPIKLNRVYDLVVSLEVAEHLPEEYADIYVKSLVTLGSIIMFSAAIPGQGGPGHVNEKWPEYWTEKFKNHNYMVIDCIRREVWKNDRVCWWFAQNLLLYVSKDSLQESQKLRELRKTTSINLLSIVHPKKYKIGYKKNKKESIKAKLQNI